MIQEKRKRQLEPFQVDADDIELDDNRVPQLEHFQLFTSNEIAEFLDSRGAEPKRVLVAGKGLGKTLLLKKKSFYYKVHKPDVLRLPKDRLCEKISSGILPQVSVRAFPVISRIETWTAIWTCAIAITVMRAIGVQLPKTLNSFVGENSRSVGEVLGEITTSLRRINRCQLALTSEARPFLAQLNKTIALFIDNVDEALKHHIGLPLYQKTKYGEGPAQRTDQIWINAQLGLLEAIRDLRHSNSHLRIFATIRQEAYDRYPYQISSQLEQICAILSYSEEDIRQIFHANIQLLDDDELINSKAKDPIERFLGRKNSAHWRVTDEAGNPVVEDLFSAFFRHTLGRPRDIMRFGRELRRLPRAARLKDDNLRKLGGLISGRIFDDYKKECVPYWDEDYENLLASINHQVLTKKEVYDISEAFVAEYPNHDHPFCFFLRKGLLGYVAKDVNHAPIQHFLTPGSDAHSPGTAFPDSPLYFIHPCLGSVLAQHAGSSPKPAPLESKIIVGNGKEVPQAIYEEVVRQQTKFTLQIKPDGRPAFQWGDMIIAALSSKFQTHTILGFAAFMAFSRTGRLVIEPAEIICSVRELENKKIISVKNLRVTGIKSVVEYFEKKLATVVDPGSKFESLDRFNEIIEKGAGFRPITKQKQGFTLRHITPDQIVVSIMSIRS